MRRTPARPRRRRSITGADDPIGRTPDPALRQYLLIRVGIGLPIVLFAVVTLILTIVHARDARAFEQRAQAAPARIVSAAKDDGSWIQHVTVEYRDGGATRQGQAPVLDPGKYHAGQSVRVLYDEGGRVLLDAERYDAASPALYGSALLVAGALPVLLGWWWVRRVRGIAGGSSPAFAMQVQVAELRPRWWNLRRPWVTLLPLDAPDQPVGSYPLMGGVPTASDAGATGEVKGHVRDGGLVVAHYGRVLWPRGRLRG